MKPKFTLKRKLKNSTKKIANNNLAKKENKEYGKEFNKTALIEAKAFNGSFCNSRKTQS